MKRTIPALLALCFLTGCTGSADIGIIGGADGPTAIVVGKKAETTAYTEMPALPGIPVPPGTFSEGWEDKNGSMLYVKTAAVSEPFFRTYVEETLPAAGYAILSPETGKDMTDDRAETVLCDGEEYSIQLQYVYGEETLTVTVTAKS